jgi:hypothetical protein
MVKGIPCILSVLLTGSASPVWAQVVGDRVLLVERANGIPGHPAPGNPGVSHRFPGSTTVTVRAIDSATGWFQVDDASANLAWIIRTYIAQIVTVAPSPSNVCYPVGTWNLEHFKNGKTRGFPEDENGGPSYTARIVNDLIAIASVIRETIGAKMLILNEINGEEREVNGEMQPRSDELDALVSHLGTSFQYIIAKSGAAQRVAILWDTRFVRLNIGAEFEVPRTEIQGSDIFARDPLLGHFTFLHNGAPQNDLVVVGLHLASGQNKNKNHDAAMTLLMSKLNEARTAGTGVVPAGEFDILIGGDLNANKFDQFQEQFFVDLNQGDWAVLAGNNYPVTRLSGVPLQPRSSIIDYIIVTRKNTSRSGLLGEEIVEAEAKVHQDLANGDWNTFRRVFSDHFPVTTCVGVMGDND